VAKAEGLDHVQMEATRYIFVVSTIVFSAANHTCHAYWLK
jgi:hypothetical protein